MILKCAYLKIPFKIHQAEESKRKEKKVVNKQKKNKERFFKKEKRKSDKLTNSVRPKTLKASLKNEAKKRLVKRFFYLKKNKKNIFEVGRTHQFRSSSTSKLPELRNPQNLKKKTVSKINSKRKTKMKTKKNPNSPEVLKLYRNLKKKEKKIQVTKHLQLRPKDFQFSPIKKIPKLESKSNRKYLQK